LVSILSCRITRTEKRNGAAFRRKPPNLFSFWPEKPGQLVFFIGDHGKCFGFNIVPSAARALMLCDCLCVMSYRRNFTFATNTRIAATSSAQQCQVRECERQPVDGPYLQPQSRKSLHYDTNTPLRPSHSAIQPQLLLSSLNLLESTQVHPTERTS
jgi:hypothetical protein